MIRTVVIYLAFVCCATAAIDNCQQGGEYCVNHWDCCSNTCLSFLYKCSTIQNRPVALGAVQSSPVYFSPPAIENLNTDTGSLQSLIEIVFRPLTVPPPSGRDVNAILSRLGEDDDNLGRETTTSYTTYYEENTTTISPTTSGPECKEIGEKCYTHDECCSKRCHGFLHQCVT